jgi:hypothetical protein
MHYVTRYDVSSKMNRICFVFSNSYSQIFSDNFDNWRGMLRIYTEWSNLKE